MKKIISILLTVAVLFTCGISAFALFPDIVEQAPDTSKLLDKISTGGSTTPGQNTNEGDIVTLLVKLGIVDATEQSGLDNPITAQEAQNMAGRLAQNASYTTSLGASKNLTLTEGYQMVIDAIGYKGLADIKGGYPQGYLSAAYELKLNKGIDAQADFTKRGYFHILKNALTVRATTAGFQDGYLVYTPTDKMIIEENFNIYIVKDVLSADGKKTLDGATVGAGKAKIGDYTAEYTDLKLSDLVGSTVTAYIRDVDDIRTLLYCEPDSKNNVLEISLNDIINPSGSDAIEYENEAGKTVRAKLDDAQMIYNGRSNLVYNAEKVKPYITGLSGKLYLHGTARLVDNDGDNRYEVVDIMAY